MDFFASAVPYHHLLNGSAILMVPPINTGCYDSLKGLCYDLLIMTTNSSLTQNVKRKVNDYLWSLKLNSEFYSINIDQHIFQLSALASLSCNPCIPSL